MGSTVVITVQPRKFHKKHLLFLEILPTHMHVIYIQKCLHAQLSTELIFTHGLFKAHTTESFYLFLLINLSTTALRYFMEKIVDRI